MLLKMVDACDNMTVCPGTVVPHRNKETGILKCSYEIVEMLGEGGFGVVYRARQSTVLRTSSSLHQKTVALKVISRQNLVQKLFEEDRVREEVKIHSQLKHDNVVALLDAFEYSECFYIVTEYCSNGDLQKVFQQRQRHGHPFSESEVRRIVFEVAQGLKYLHGHGIMHRDIKMANIFVYEDGSCKIGDFGFATMKKKTEASDRFQSTQQTICGTPSSIAPEVISKKSYTQMIDVWGLGVILYTLLVGKPPFDDGNVRTTFQNVQVRSPELPKTLSPNATHLINGILQKDESKRLNLQEVLNHEFLRNTGSLVYDSGICTSSNLTRSLTNSRSGSKQKRPEIRQQLSVIPESLDHRWRMKASSLHNFKHLSSPPLSLPRSESVNAMFLTNNGSLKTNDAKLKPKLNTQRLRSTNVMPFKEGARGAILPSGEVQFEFDVAKKSGRRIVERVTVSPSGDAIRVERRPSDSPHYTGECQELTYEALHSCHRRYIQEYNTMAHFIQLCRECQTKVILHAKDAECKLMENEPCPNFQVHFLHSAVSVHYNARKNEIKYTNSTGENWTFPYPVSVSHPSFLELPRFEELYDECKEIVRACDSIPCLSDKYPIEFGRKEKRSVLGSNFNSMTPSQLTSRTSAAFYS